MAAVLYLTSVYKGHENIRINRAISHAMTISLKSASKRTEEMLFVHASDSPHPGGANRYLQLLIHKETRHSLTRPDAHTRQQDLLLLSPTFAKPGADLSGAGSSERVSQRDGSTSDVHFRGIDAQDVCAVDGH